MSHLTFPGPQCTEPKDEGKGKARLLKYFYDPQLQYCVRSSIKVETATATASKAIETVWKHVYPKQKKSTRMRVNELVGLNTAFVDLTWVIDVSCFFLRVPQIMSVLCQRTKAPVLPSFPCIITTMKINSAVCSYMEAAEETATVLILERIVRKCVSVQFKSRFAIFNQYNVNNMKLNSWDRFPLNSGKKVQWCHCCGAKAKRYT